MAGCQRGAARRPIARWWGGTPAKGAELALGFAVNGLVAREAAFLRKGGLRAGRCADPDQADRDRNAARRRHARQGEGALGDGRHRAHDPVERSNRRAAEVLRRSRRACAATDVTGFGLLGHLVEMTKRASGVDVELLAVERVPLIEGARESVARGIFSSLQPQNLRLRRAIRDLDAAQLLPLYPLLFDPQTAGGLLASVPDGRAAACVAALHVAGYKHAAAIGAVLTRTDAAAAVTLTQSKRAGSWFPQPAGGSAEPTEAVGGVSAGGIGVLTT